MDDDATVPVVLLPVAAVRLAGRYFVPLALWFSAGAIVRYLLIQEISRLGHGGHSEVRRALVLLPLSVTVLASLAVTIGMMFTLGRGLKVIHDPAEPYVTAISRTLFPFVLIYLGWNLYTDDLRAVLRADAQRLADAGDAMNAGNLLDLSIVVCLVVAAVAWLLRFLCERRYESRPSRTLEVLIAFLEVDFTLYALYSVVRFVRGAQRWIADREFWHAITGVVSLPGPGPVEDALILPLVWLAIAAIVYGLEMRDREAVQGTPLEKIPDRLAGHPRRLAEVASRSLREKYVPVVHAVRLVLRAGAPAFAWFCLCYVAIGALMDRLQRGVVVLIGTDHTVRFWNLALTPVEFGRHLLQEILRLALLAAMFDLVMRKVSAGTPAPDRPEPATDPDADAASPARTSPPPGSAPGP
ncbi:hypothetical protein [Actinomadura sp. DC4]|uniref:hypothetical protein n=1 Tax=Actinomadura sp. DC4 TaxID=3055069 RepID=UPI0025AF460C|nr:hypothetical protein [Actinomadura sp. DC4]MDN3351788.1 hypothetical protein [Actinomadura sp. DC4]